MKKTITFDDEKFVLVPRKLEYPMLGEMWLAVNTAEHNDHEHLRYVSRRTLAAAPTSGEK